MRGYRSLVGLAGCLSAAVAPHVPSATAESKAACTTLSCEVCEEIVQATCDARYRTCEAARQRACPARSRSCSKGMTFELCAQCMPVQYVEGGRRIAPGRTELCRTDPG